jgi:hypothetical protein
LVERRLCDSLRLKNSHDVWELTRQVVHPPVMVSISAWGTTNLTISLRPTGLESSDEQIEKRRVENES